MVWTVSRIRPAELIAACLEDLRAFADGPALDDLTLLAIQRAQ